MSLDALVRPLATHLLDPDQARLIRALRLWVLAARLRWCPLAAVAPRLGGIRAAAHLGMLIEAIGAAWPDRFCVSPPCAQRLSHDEATFSDMMALAACGDRPAFDSLLADLISAPSRDRLFQFAGLLAAQIDG